MLKVRVRSETIELYHGPVLALSLPRLSGRNRHRIDYRHLIWSLVRKPGAFANYCYREELFPTTVFRRAYDNLLEAKPTKADAEYLRLLHLAASTSEAEVELAIKLLLEAGRTPTFDAVRELTGTTKPAPAPAIAKTTIDLSDYDTLLTPWRPSKGYRFKVGILQKVQSTPLFVLHMLNDAKPVSVPVLLSSHQLLWGKRDPVLSPACALAFDLDELVGAVVRYRLYVKPGVVVWHKDQRLPARSLSSKEVLDSRLPQSLAGRSLRRVAFSRPVRVARRSRIAHEPSSLSAMPVSVPALCSGTSGWPYCGASLPRLERVGGARRG